MIVSKDALFSKSDLCILIDNLRPTMKAKRISCQKNWSKPKILDAIAKTYGKQNETAEFEDAEIPATLTQQLAKYKKSQLNMSYCWFEYPHQVQEWKASGFPDNVKIEGTDEPQMWYTKPEVLELENCQKFMHFAYIDPTHILTNLCVKMTNEGCAERNISPDAWKEASQTKESGLNPSLVESYIFGQVSFQ